MSTNHANSATTNGEPSTKSINDIIIIGGSLGGLFAGVALKTHGYNTTILERTNAFLLDNQGAGIVAGGDTIAFFEKYDRSGIPVAVPSFKRLYLDQRGDVVHEELNRQNMTSWDLSYYLLRANYDRVESAYLQGGKLPEERPTDGKFDYQPGCTVMHIEDEGDMVRVKYLRKDPGTGAEVEDSVTTRLVIAADGPSSTVRSLFEPEVKRTYAGYVVIRGTVPEAEASPEALEVFRERFCFFHAPGIQNLTYTIAGVNGDTRPGHRLLNFVWYTNFPQGEPEHDKLSPFFVLTEEDKLRGLTGQIVTDADGRKRHITIPPGKIAWDAWEMVKSQASARLPPQMAEMATKTRTPFVQCITDSISPRNLYFGDKVVLVGDALAGFRPHTVASTSQAAFDVMRLVDWLDGKIDRKTFVQDTMRYARLIQHRGVQIGNRSQFENLPLEEYIADRNMMSIPRKDLEYPSWTDEGIDSI